MDFNINLNSEYLEQLIEQERLSLLVTGKAGSGKSIVLFYLIVFLLYSGKKIYFFDCVGSPSIRNFLKKMNFSQKELEKFKNKLHFFDNVMDYTDLNKKLSIIKKENSDNVYYIIDDVTLLTRFDETDRNEKKIFFGNLPAKTLISANTYTRPGVGNILNNSSVDHQMMYSASNVIHVEKKKKGFHIRELKNRYSNPQNLESMNYSIKILARKIRIKSIINEL